MKVSIIKTISMMMVYDMDDFGHTSEYGYNKNVGFQKASMSSGQIRIIH